MGITSIFLKIRATLRYLLYLRKGAVMNVTIHTLLPNSELKYRICVVTGGAKGLGLVIVKRLLSSGAKVVIVGSNKSRLDDAEKELASDNVRTFHWGLTDVRSLDARINAIAHCFDGRDFDVWINNAAYLSAAPTFQKDSTETFDRTFDLNVKSLLFVSKAVCDYYKNNGIQGKMITISSMNAKQAYLDAYYLSKSTADKITEALAAEYVKYGIIVNGIAPGFLPSGINAADVTENVYNERNYSRRYVLLEEVAELALFLSCGRANSIVGQTIMIDGGTTLRTVE